MAADEHRAALAGEVGEHVADPADAFRVEPVGRLVEDQDLRVAEEGGGQLQALAHPEGVTPHEIVGARRETDALEHGFDRRATNAGADGEDPKRLAPGDAGVESGRLDERADPRDHA